MSQDPVAHAFKDAAEEKLRRKGWLSPVDEEEVRAAVALTAAEARALEEITADRDRWQARAAKAEAVVEAAKALDLEELRSNAVYSNDMMHDTGGVTQAERAKSDEDEARVVAQLAALGTAVDALNRDKTPEVGS